MTDNAMIIPDQFAQALAAATSIPEVKDLRDYAEAARRYAKARGLGIDYENRATSSILRTERKIGTMLEDLIADGTLATQGVGKAQGAVLYEDLGFKQQDAYSWRQAAKIPEDQFEAMLRLAIESGTRLAKVNFYRAEPKPRDESVLPTKEDGGFVLFREGVYQLVGWTVDKDGAGRPTKNGLINLPLDEIAKVGELLRHMISAYNEAKAAR